MAEYNNKHIRALSNKDTILNHEQGGENDNEDNLGNHQDLVNFKGIYYGDENQKFTDEVTGAHFRFSDMY